ncbi:MAG: hypothetical protein J7M38_11795 [Armatimonadetes bacterium]|nr:hypothetical protein [Armatimonadota bacterium]
MRISVLPVVALIAAACGPAYALGPELITNPSMETDADGDEWPDGWRTSADVEYHIPTRLGSNPYTIERSADAHSGQWCLHYKAAEAPPPRLSADHWWDLAAWLQARGKWIRTWAIPVVSPRFAVEGETDYLLSMWIKAVGARILHLKFIGHYAGMPETKTHWTQPLLKSPTGGTHMDGSWDWTRFQTHLFVPGGQEWGRLEVWLWQDGQPCELWVDDVSARQVDAGGDAQ